ncbi:MAG: hypothetical protein AB7K24_34985, partial [Gemmataceae bacterium]
MNDLKQALLAIEIAALGLGVYLLVAARLRWGKLRVLDGTPARIVGILLVSPWPLAQITRLLFGLASWDPMRYSAANEWPFLQGEILLVFFVLFFAWVVTMYGTHEPGRAAAVLAAPLPPPAVFAPPVDPDDDEEEEHAVLENQDGPVEPPQDPVFENEAAPEVEAPAATTPPEAEPVPDEEETDKAEDLREHVTPALAGAAPVPDAPSGPAPVGGVWSEEIQ